LAGAGDDLESEQAEIEKMAKTAPKSINITYRLVLFILSLLWWRCVADPKVFAEKSWNELPYF
jgi:hypothetical protein